MILRKPYAFFIKYFKLFHAIMAVLIAFLLYRSFTIYSFFKAYVVDYSSALSEMSPRSLLTFYTFLMLLVVIIIIIILFSVMIYKKKPKLLYIYSLIVYILIIILCAITSPILRDITVTNLDVRVSSALRDFFLMAVITQAICLVLYIVRATGFDIKRFDFVTDLQQLDIDEKDSEEIEVALEFDSNQTRRQIRYKLRQLKYVYGENKFIMNTIGIIAVVIIAFTVYFNVGVYTARYNQGDSFSASNFVLNVRNTYLTQNDPSGSSLTSDNMIVVIKMDIKSSGGSGETLNTGLITLNIGDESYSQNNDYAKEVYDLGIPYTGQELTDEFKTYILAFLIPAEDADESMILKVNDDVSYVNGELGAKNILISLEPTQLTDDEDMGSVSLGSELSFEDSVLESGTLQINSYEIADKFKLEYTYCYATDKCIDSSEYVTATMTGNYLKTLMKIDGTFSLDSNLNSSQITTFLNFANTFGTIFYKIDDTWYSREINSQSIKPTVATTSSIFIEVPAAAKDADEIYLRFKIRNYIYKYVLK